jgi:hypothetical protein
MRSFGPSLDRRRVRYLLISGQASILYGAATFSEDIDVWIDPTAANARRFVDALEDLGARVYKLTPPMTVRNLRRGHGFHFVLPPDDVFLDVMGQPPRVGSFSRSWRRKRWFDSDWGRVPAVSPEDLVELKKTRRAADYDVISGLVAIRAAEAKGDARILRWALDSTFRVEDMRRFARKLGERWDATRGAAALHEKMRRCQELDEGYWSGIIRELRMFRARGLLIPSGSPAKAALGRGRGH